MNGDLVARTKRFAAEVDALVFSFDGYIYNPLDYAWEAHRTYLERYIHPHAEVLFLGMNPGPFGMAQTGVPFGEIRSVVSWLGINTPVGKPPREHPARAVVGFAIGRSEKSGERFWGLMQQRFGTPEAFFAHHAVMNYCPLVFMDKGPTGRNVVPEALAKAERIALEQVCDAYLADVIQYTQPRYLVGVGKYAQKKLEHLAALEEPVETPRRSVLSILHPSPGNPQANAGWDVKVSDQLREAHVWA